MQRPRKTGPHCLRHGANGARGHAPHLPGATEFDLALMLYLLDNGDEETKQAVTTAVLYTPGTTWKPYTEESRRGLASESKSNWHRRASRRDDCRLLLFCSCRRDRLP